MPIQNFKRTSSNRRVPTFIVPEFREVNPMEPLLRACMNEAMQKGFQTLIHTLHLTVGLKVVGRAHSQLNSSSSEKLFP